MNEKDYRRGIRRHDDGLVQPTFVPRVALPKLVYRAIAVLKIVVGAGYVKCRKYNVVPAPTRVFSLKLLLAEG